MNVFITGGTGFIGSRLALKCLERGDRVLILGQENTAAEKQNKLLLQRKGAEVVLGSVADQNLVTRLTEGIDVIFHLAAAQHEANISNNVFREVNVYGTQNVLEAGVASGVKKIVHGSTIGVYGSSDSPLSEDSSCKPENIYGLTKLEGEKRVLSFRDKIPLVIIRISETYGPGDRRLLKLFRAIHKKAFFKIGSGQNLHQLIYIDDLTEGLLQAANSQRAVNETILLVGRTAITTDEMVETIAGALKVKLPRFRAPLFPFLFLAMIMELVLRPLGIQPPLHRRRMDFFKKSFSFSTNKGFDLLGFTPQFNFKKGVTETAQWYREMGLLSGEDGHRCDLADTSGNDTKMQIDADLAAQIEPFDTFWEAPENIEKGFTKFAKFYKRNYFKYLPENKNCRNLVVSCGAGYMVELMQKEGYTDVLGIDCDSAKIDTAQNHGLNCKVANAFPFLRDNQLPFDFIFAEQEINHLTKAEIISFLNLCHANLKEGGLLILHSLNGANPLTGSEALAQNFDHFNTFTEYSLKQILMYTGFCQIKAFPLNLYIFYENPVNYIGLILNAVLNVIFRLGFIFYGKDNKIFSKKIAVVSKKPIVS
jgi:nucleoside-diphosphate-sugar epimerase/2-polyprenyl-3-methyl-5-hydroxy-6-metoxy-1,4-benzoquinol methylase